MSDSKPSGSMSSRSGEPHDSPEAEARQPHRDRTICIGGVAPARDDLHRTMMPASIRKQAYLSVVGGSRKYAEINLDSDVTTIGRGPGVDFVLDEPSASRKHASITKVAQGHVLRDLGSTNGTYLKGVLNNEERLLEDDDCFRIGGSEIVYHASRRS